jgi:hypothetical protein
MGFTIGRRTRAVALLLAAAGGCSQQSAAPPAAPSSTILTPENVFGPALPGGATILTPAEFEARVRAGTLTLARGSDEAAALQAAAAQRAADRASLQAIPTPSDGLKALLGPKPDAVATSAGDLLIKIPDGLGGTRTVTTIGDGVAFRSVIEANERYQAPANALAVYQLAYDQLPQAVQGKAATPASLAGAGLPALRAALAALDALLASQPDGAMPVSARLAPTESPSQRLQQANIIMGGPVAGNGTDGPFGCRNDPAGLYRNVVWPLKYMLPPVKNQGNRGTCWGFAAVGAVEARERVVTGAQVNLSEQHYVNLAKFGDASAPWQEGDSGRSLGKFVDNNWSIAFEPEWTYNPGTGMTPGNLSGVCTGYSGSCSETSHESPSSCTRADAGIFCGYEAVTYAGTSSIKASRTRSVWVNLLIDPDPPVATMRHLLASGQVLVASFPVLPDFNSPPDTGYVPDNGGASGGDHLAQIVGFVPDALAPVAPPAGGTGGGWFVIKNSWGCNGDGGFWYVTQNYLKRYFHFVDVLEMPATRSQAWVDNLAQLQPPVVTLSTDSGGATVPVGRTTTVTATVTGGGPGCCALNWTPTPTSMSGQTAAYRLATAGTVPVSVTATTLAGVATTTNMDLQVVNTPPRAIITSPLPGVAFAGTDVHLAGYGMDANDGFAGAPPGEQVTTLCRWSSDFPVAEGPWNICTGPVRFATIGTRNLTLTITDQMELTGAASVTLIVEPAPANAPPVPTLVVTAPSWSNLAQDWNTSFTLTSSATDAENNVPFTFDVTVTALSEAGAVQGTPLDLGGAPSITWIPYRDSFALVTASGACATTSGQRIRLTLRVTDSAGQVGSSSQELRISCPPG